MVFQRNATFRNNEARFDGGAISLFRAYTSLEVETSTFTGNKAGEAGGAIYCLGSDDALYLKNVTITGNHAGTQGGGVYLTNGSYDSTFDGVTVKDNTCGADREKQNQASNLYLTGGSRIGHLYHPEGRDNDICIGTDGTSTHVAYSSGYPYGLRTSEPGWQFNCGLVKTGYYDVYMTHEAACAQILGIRMEGQIRDADIDHQACTITVALPYNANLKRVILEGITLPSDGSYSTKPTCESLMDLRTPQMIEVEKVGLCLSVYTITAQLEQVPDPTVTVENGTGSGIYAEGSTVTITAADRAGYTFEKWTGEGVTFDNANANAATTTFTMPGGDVTVTATYKAVLTDISGVVITAEAPVAGEVLATPATATRAEVATMLMNFCEKVVK